MKWILVIISIISIGTAQELYRDCLNLVPDTFAVSTSLQAKGGRVDRARYRKDTLNLVPHTRRFLLIAEKDTIPYTVIREPAPHFQLKHITADTTLLHVLSDSATHEMGQGVYALSLVADSAFAARCPEDVTYRLGKIRVYKQQEYADKKLIAEWGQGSPVVDIRYLLGGTDSGTYMISIEAYIRIRYTEEPVLTELDKPMVLRIQK